MWTAIISAILSFAKLWIDGKQKQQLEWQSRVLKGKLSSAISTHEIEKRIRSVKPLKISRTPAAWNRVESLGLVFAFAFLLPCCGPVFVESRWPIIDRPPRPTLPESPIIFTHRELILVDYAEILELTIDVFNEMAEEHNQEHGYTARAGDAQ